MLDVDGQGILLFSCDAPALAGARTGEVGGVWAVPADSPTGPFDIGLAHLIVDDRLFAGRITRDRDGRSVLLAFENGGRDGEFAGVLSDPIPVAWDAATGRVAVVSEVGR